MFGSLTFHNCSPDFWDEALKFPVICPQLSPRRDYSSTERVELGVVRSRVLRGVNY